MDTLKRLPHGGIAFFALTAFGAVKGFAVIPVLFGLLGETGYGTYVLVATSTGYGLILAIFGLDTALYRFLPGQLAKTGAARVFNGVIQACLVWNGVIVAAVCFFVAVSDHSSSQTELILSGTVISAASAVFGLCAAEFRARERLLRFCAIVILFQGAELGAFLVGAYLFNDVGAMYVGVAICDAVLALIVLVARWRSIGLVRPDRTQLTESIRFGAHSVLSSAISSSYLVFDKYLITAFAGVAALAAYGVAFAVAGVLLQIVGIIALLVPTRFARAYDDNDRDAQASVMAEGFRVYASLAVPAAVGILYVGEPLMALLTNADTAAKAYPLALILTLAFVVTGCCRVLVIAIRTAGDQVFVSTVLAVLLAVFLAASVLASLSGVDPAFAAAAAILAVSIVQAIVLLWRANQKQIPLGLTWRAWAWPLVGAALMGAPIYWISIVDILALVLAVLSAMAVYGGFMVWVTRRA